MNYPKLFLFCIGGTGARVMKALTFLLASGVDIKASKVIPIIIDPDNANGDVQRVVEIMKNYQNTRKKLEFNKNKFFKTDIQTLASLQDEGNNTNLKVEEGFRFDFDGIRDGVFKDFIGLSTMSTESQGMMNLLFSESNLKMELEVGFKGNPHMGSVVLNQFEESDTFKYFTSRFAENDRIFIIGSIFGGTGAAGLPLLVKNIREANEKTPNHDRIKNAPIGILTVKPYFGVEPDDNSAIDSNTFIAKTKAALEYYHDNLSGNNSVNVHYYIGDSTQRAYVSAEGRAAQKNDAHPIEIFSALGILDFMNYDKESLACTNSKVIDPKYKEYGIIGDTGIIQYNNLGAFTKQSMLKPLSCYVLSLNFWKNALSGAINKPESWTKNSGSDINSTFLASDFYNNCLKIFNDRFREWLNELQRNDRAFSVFNSDTEYLHHFFHGYELKKKTLFGGEKSEELTYADFNYKLNAIEGKLSSLPIEQRFMAIFSMSTNELITEKFSTLFN